MEKSSKIINLIILIRLIIFALIFLIISVLNIVFDGPAQKELLLNMTLSVLFFSIFVFIASKTINLNYAFYLNPVFDTFFVTFIVVNTGFVNSPFMVFFTIIIFYMGLMEGKLGGFIEVLIILMSFIIFDVFKSDISIINSFNYGSLFVSAQYFVSFLIVLALSIYLNHYYKTRDIEKKNIEDRFKSLQNLYENIIQSINIGILLLSDTNRILSCNNAAGNILGESEQNIIGKKLESFFKILTNEQDLIQYNNKFIGYKLQDFYSYQNQVKGKLLIFQDVTEKEILKQELEKQEKLATLGTFSSIIAHEIKNPLGAINGCFQMLKKKTNIDNKLSNIIEREINRLNLVLNNLLYMSKPATKHKDYINVNKLIAEFIDSMNSYEMFDEISFNVEFTDVLISHISEYEVKQILWNLFLNTYEIKSDANVNIKIFNNNGKKVFSYEDNGPGIESAVISDVLQPFFTTKKSGTGLGLYIIKMICDKYNIDYKLYSKQEFSGFKLDLYFEANGEINGENN